jgi:hypothetical protein
VVRSNAVQRIPEAILHAGNRLFWDVDVNRLDPERHEDFIFGRVLSDGTTEMVRALRAYFMCQQPGFGLAAALRAFEARFASASPDLLHRVKALTFFEDAEREPELLLLKPVDWADIRAYFEREVSVWWQG